MAQNKESGKDNLLSLLYFGYITFALFGTNAKERHQDQVDADNRNIEIPVEEDPENLERDPFDAVDDFRPAGVPFNELDTHGKIKRVLLIGGKIVALLALLYLFICSLSFLTSAFRLLSGVKTGEAFRSNSITSNPIAGLMMGVLGTVLLQSSSTTTSVVVAMVGAGTIDVRSAIPIVMGANIGTSVTNTIVSIGQIGDREQFRRAFAGATVHDMFNILSVLIILPLELITRYLFEITQALVKNLSKENVDESLDKDLLKKITKPFTNLIIQLDKNAIKEIAVAKDNETVVIETLIKQCSTQVSNSTQAMLNETNSKSCNFLFHDSGMSDAAVGTILLILSLVILCICLLLIVKTLHSLLRGQIALAIKKSINADFKQPFKFLAGYLAILVGAGMTVLVQSSSIFTSTLTPLVGFGIVALRRVYPLTLGSNIGTTATGILAALASDELQKTMQIALCNLFFNISGIILWYPIPLLRKVPINLAKSLGNTVARYRWFAAAYLLTLFFIIPGIIFSLSLAGWKIFTGIMVPVVVFVLIFVFITVLQRKRVEWLPARFQNWEWLPKPCRSLEPYDRMISKLHKKTLQLIRRDAN